MNRNITISMGCELLKLLREKPMSRRQIAETTGWNKCTVKRWTTEYAAQGLLDAKPGKRITANAWGGRAPMVYVLAPAWRHDGPAA